MLRGGTHRHLRRRWESPSSLAHPSRCQKMLVYHQQTEERVEEVSLATQCIVSMVYLASDCRADRLARKVCW